VVAAVAKRAKAKSTTAKPLWIVLTPSVDHEAWLKALLRTAADCGRELVSFWTTPEPRAKDSPPVLYVTHDAALLAEVDPADVVVIMPQPETAAETTAELYDLYPPYSVFHASLLLARAVALGKGARILTAEQLSRKPARIELFPGVIVEPPEAERGTPRPAVSVALGMYRLGRPRPGTTVTWSERLFTYDPKSFVEGEPLGVLDVTGRPRTLFYGPYLALPPGRWNIVIRFAVDDFAAGHELRFDWGLAGDFISQTESPRTGGVYEVEMTHNVTEVGPWQFRVLLMEGAFEGRMTFLGGIVTLLPDEDLGRAALDDQSD
jgi:hypothetical protein